jgi:glycosyltransferase involved in cell wall biosynthesis
MKDDVFFSIIMVSLNSERFIEKSICSVLSQTFSNFELIIQDGESTDNTLNIIKKYNDPRIKLLSEPDYGIYNAMNKGIIRASGKYIAILNSDDEYYTNTLLDYHTILKHFDLDFVYSNYLLIDESGSPLKIINATNKIPFYKMPYGHNTLICSSKIYTNISYDEHYALASDYDFIHKIMKINLKSSHINSTLTKFRIGGASVELKSLYETYNINCKYNNSFVSLFYFIKYFSYRKIYNAINHIH